ncbi:type II toxin-antitoxin system VapC family toxin [Phragmitibacter flavus]|uniref:Type II toxin-antitoxin system VapC family toxin n=1 Tax=Phragmitibacter flavus TaxID=2576071 RepID=A0A5R8KK54_9BACT|nr:PIN domain-containing protein [Phragmitibacter flavus]TLD72630.1 type II toxin-antitoxin system VapC family toxin [Phragmitibacter flavus]
MVIACDTSFLFSLYGSDRHSERAVSFISTIAVPLRLTTLTQFEFGNALRFAEFRKVLKSGEALQHRTRFEVAISQGRLIVENCNLADVVEVADRLSAMRTLLGGHRGFDILHVAGALKLKATHFLTFDHNQKKLAEAEGLIVPL